MARQMPEFVRAAAGLAAAVLDGARKLPQTLPGLPVRVVGLAMQTAMKVQQGYSGLVARGDEVFTGIRGEKEPGLATFDEDLEEPAAGTGYRESAFDRAEAPTVDNEVSGVPDHAADATVAAAAELADQIGEAQERLDRTAAQAPGTEAVLDELAIDELVDAAPAPEGVPVGDAGSAGNALLEVDRGRSVAAGGSAEVDVPATGGGVTTADAIVTDEGIATPEPAEERPRKRAAKKAAAKKAPAKRAAKKAAAKKAAPESDVVTEAEAAVDDAVGSTASPAEGGDTTTGTATSDTASSDTASSDTATSDTASSDTATSDTETSDTAPAGGAAPATDEAGGTVAAATGVRTDVDRTDTSADDSAIAEGSAVDAVGGESAAPTDDAQGGSELSGAQAAGTAPVDGYDGFSIAQLRGRLRGYARPTVEQLLDYEQATRAREPYLRMLRNRLERLESDNS